MVKRGFLVAVAMLISSTVTAQEPFRLVDYYDGLRAWDIGEKEIASGIWMEAAKRGDIRSIRRLARLLERGEILPQDKALALFWYLALSELDPSADIGAEIEDLKSSLSRRDIDEVTKSAREWKPSKRWDVVAKKSLNANAQEDAGRRLIERINVASQAELDELSVGVDLASLQDEKGRPFVFSVVAARKPLLLRKIVSSTHRPNQALSNGSTLLHLAAAIGDDPTIDTLIELGANGAIQDNNGAWAWQIAQQANHERLSERLKTKQEADTETFLKKLSAFGYLGSDAIDADISESLKMYQTTRSIPPSGVFDEATFLEMNVDKTPRPFVYVVRWETPGSYHYNRSSTYGVSRDNVIATADKECSGADISSCVIDVVPIGSCVGIFNREGEKFVLSELKLSKADAEDNGRTICEQGEGKCSLKEVVCGAQ